MYLSYNSTKIIPAPFCKFTTEVTRTQDGNKVGKNLTVTLTGTFVYGKGGATYSGSGYPADDYSKCALEDLLTKQQDLRDLFETDYQWFEIQPDPEATAPSFKWSAKVRSIDFDTSRLNPRSDYTVVLELQHDPWDGIQGIEETWELQEQESPRDTYSLTHKLACTSREEYDTAGSSLTAGWKKALDHIISQMGGLGIDGGIVYADPGLDLAVTFTDYNYLVTKLLDEANGRYDITETWLMSEDAYTEDQTISAEYNRDGSPNMHWTVSAEGTILGHNTGSPTTDWATVISRWTTVKSNLYTDILEVVAIEAPGTTIRTQPTVKRVTHDELNRTLTYTYTYDEGSTWCNEDITTTVSINEEECNLWTVNVEGTITGITDGTDSAYDKALSCYNNIDTDTLANTAYDDSGGSGTLRGPISRSIRHNEYQGTIGFSATYHDRATATKHDKTISLSYNRESDVTSVTVDGTIGGDCAASWSDVTTAFAAITMASTYSDASTMDGDLCAYAESVSRTENQLNLTASYSYTFSDDLECSANIDQSITVKDNPSECGSEIAVVECTITGRRTSLADPWTNAQSEYSTNHSETAAKTAASAFISGSLNKQMKSVTYAEHRFTINYSYEFTNQGTYTVDETITESWGGDDECGVKRIVQDGTVTGLCTGSAGSAYTNALSGYGSVGNPTGGTNLVRQSVSRNQNRGTISYTREFDDRDNPYVIDYTETVRESIESCYKSVTIEGQVTGVCQNNDATSKIDNADTGYATVVNSLEPSENSGSGWKLVSNSKGRSEYSGRITFSKEYREKSRCIEGAISESIEVNDEMAADVFAVVNVIGGPAVIQDKGGSTVQKRTVTIQVQTDPDCESCGVDIGGGPNVESYVDAAAPAGGVVVVASNSKSWNPRTGQYRRSKSWVYGNC